MDKSRCNKKNKNKGKEKILDTRFGIYSSSIGHYSYVFVVSEHWVNIGEEKK